MSERLVPSGACMFSCLLIGVNRLAVRAHVNCGFVFTCELCNVFFFLGGGRRRRRGEGFRVSDPQCRCVFSVHFRGGGVLPRTFARRVLLASDGLALVILLTHGHDPSVVKMSKKSSVRSGRGGRIPACPHHVLDRAIGD